MIIFTILVSVLSALAMAQSGANPISPIGSISAGQPTTIKWTATTQGTISLQLRWGADKDHLNPGVEIVSGISNSGSYTWTPPTALKGEKDYSVQIIDDKTPSQTNYSPYFEIQSSGSGISSPGTTGSTTTTGTSSTAKSSSTTSTTDSSTTSGSSSTSASTTSSSASSTTSTAASKTSSAPTKAPSSNAGAKGKGCFAAMIGAGLLAAAL